jgi:hypothetical protein
MGNNSDNYYSKDIKSSSIATATVDIVDAETEISTVPERSIIETCILFVTGEFQPTIIIQEP